MSSYLPGRKIGVISDVILVESFITINQIRAGLPALALPKSISLFICPKNQHPSLGNTFSFQGFASCVSQQLPDALVTVWGNECMRLNPHWAPQVADDDAGGAKQPATTSNDG